MNIYVGNLSFDMTEAQLQSEFEAHGAVSSVKLVADRETGRPRGFAFVEMADSGQGRAAIDALDGKQVSGRTMKVNEARPRRDGGR